MLMAAIEVTMNRLLWQRMYCLAETRFKLEAQPRGHGLPPAGVSPQIHRANQL